MNRVPYDIRVISNKEEARTVRTLVFSDAYELRPLVRGESVGEEGGSSRLFQRALPGDYILTTSLQIGTKLPLVRLTRHRHSSAYGRDTASFLNSIDPILRRYLMDFKI